LLGDAGTRAGACVSVPGALEVRLWSAQRLPAAAMAELALMPS